MIVRELEELLALLPADMTVCIEGGHGCKHITEVDKMPRRRRVSPEIEAGMAALGPVRAVVGGTHYPPALVLRSRYSGPMWWAAYGDDVDYAVVGRWPSREAPRAR